MFGTHRNSIWPAWALLAAAGLLALPAAARQANQDSPQGASQDASGASAPAVPQSETDRRAETYYQFSIARMYEEQYEFTGRADYAGKAIAAYRRAYELDPHSSVTGERLAEALARAGRIPEAIQEAQDVLVPESPLVRLTRSLGSWIQAPTEASQNLENERQS